MDGMKAALGIVGLHYAANLAHGVTHEGVPVALTTVQTVFVVLVVGMAPLASLWLLRKGRARLAWGTLAVVLLASLGFGLVFHYVLDTADHVANVSTGPWHGPFVGTAAAIAVVDGVGVAVALWFSGRTP